jgi:hypothetical protein
MVKIELDRNTAASVVASGQAFFISTVVREDSLLRMANKKEEHEG